MNLLEKAENKMAFGKVGILGFQGSGKSYTAALIAIGIGKMTKTNQVAFFDTETGSDFLLPIFNEAGVETLVAKKRAFTDLLSVIKECEDGSIPILIIDSITHVWRDLCQSYDKKLKRRGRLQFQDWAMVKGEWQLYTDAFVNSPVHIIVCGRAGYEYDYDYNEDGSKDLVKTGTKMKVENEFGFEPSLVIEMERLSENRAEVEAIRGDKKKKTEFKPKVGSKWIHRAHVLKDRTDKINGESFDYPTFDNFLPHFKCLNLGGEHFAIDTESDSTGRFDNQGRTDWHKEQKEKSILRDEIQNYLVELWPSSTKDDKNAKADMIELLFGRRSWTYVEEKAILPALEESRLFLDHFRTRYPEMMQDQGFADMEQKDRLKKAKDIVADELKQIASLENDIPY